MRLGIDPIVQTDSTENISEDINSRLDQIDSLVGLEAQGTTRPPPGVPGRRWTSTSTKVTWYDSGSGWRQVAPAPSVSSSDIANNSIPLSTPLQRSSPGLSAGHFIPESPFYTSSPGIMWYKDPFGFVHLEGSVFSTNPTQSGMHITIITLDGDTGPPPVRAGSPLLLRAYSSNPIYNHQFYTSVGETPARLRVYLVSPISPTYGLGLSGIYYIAEG